jgi:hypothetical protein
MAAALPLLPEPPPPPDPLAPGPFAFADRNRLHAILSDAGYADITIAPQDRQIGSKTLDQAVEVALKIGPLGALLRDQPDRAALVVGAIREALAAHLTPEGVRLDSATWIVSARRP